MIRPITLYSCVILGVAAHGAAAGDYSIYGKAQVQLEHTDKGVMRYTDKGTHIDAPFSRIGVKGKHDISAQAQVVYKYEVQVKGFESDDTSEPFSARNTYLGVQSAYGKVLFGRNDSRFKYSEGKIDQFNETQSDIAQTIGGQDRIADSITYTSPKWGQWQWALTFAPKDDAKTEKNGVAALLSYGDRALKQTPYYLALSYTDALADIQALRVNAVYQWQRLQGGVLVQRSENLAGDKDGNSVLVSLRYYASDAWQPKLQYARDTSQLRHDSDSEQLSAGVDYVVDKQTSFYFLATKLELNQVSDTSTAIGLKYKF
ncbi:porin [Pseudoalteromonas ruthenica]|uniref:porin n=1 Tax=Pseudoalteromonas ruthenica TaxID=151081 RepID=UPI000475D219|nr:porin [Pseudoalteromonas ruthenica]